MREEKKQYLSGYLLQEAKIKRLENMLEKNPENAEQYKKLIIEAKKLREEIENKIKSVDNELLSEVLYQKYVFGKTLEQIGYIINYSKRHTERLHQKALEEFKM